MENQCKNMPYSEDYIIQPKQYQEKFMVTPIISGPLLDQTQLQTWFFPNPNVYKIRMTALQYLDHSEVKTMTSWQCVINIYMSWCLLVQRCSLLDTFTISYPCFSMRLKIVKLKAS